MWRRLSGCVLLLLPLYQLLAQGCTSQEDRASAGDLPTQTAFWQQQLKFSRVRVALAGTGTYCEAPACTGPRPAAPGNTASSHQN
ncbi:hypothetical protein [Hymenobacter lapidarius]|uniref:hypothetical protein n=1 Tax=Hymenobacter lapidarius TaxID=1908237 RepID=UPI000F7AE9A2|nr:hypothetical protein [Hymenobacter lapidarius]